MKNVKRLIKKIKTSLEGAISKNYTFEPIPDEMLNKVGRNMPNKGLINNYEVEGGNITIELEDHVTIIEKIDLSKSNLV